MNPACEDDRRSPGTQTRDAVETAIDLSKDAREGTWEQRVKHGKRITRWTEDTRASDAP